MLTLAVVTLNDSTDVHQWSGTTYHLTRALERAGARVHRVGPLAPRWTFGMKLRQRWSALTGRTYHAVFDPASLSSIGRDARARIPDGCDAVLAVTSLIAAAIGPLGGEAGIPLVSWDDATVAALMGYYPDFTRIAPVSERQGHAMARRAAASADLCVYTSEWAADSARRAYGLAPQRVAVVPFGANLAHPPSAPEVRERIAARAAALGDGGEPVRLLWIGVEWERKGGALALDIARGLAAQGRRVELALVGCDPPAGTVLPDWAHALGYVSKGTAEGDARLAALFADAHLLVVPSRAEAYGLVFAEAAAFGVPAVAIATGGVPTIVADDETGLLLPGSATARGYVSRVAALLDDRARYETMALAARARWEEELNWDAAARRMLALIERVVAGSVAPEPQ